MVLLNFTEKKQHLATNYCKFCNVYGKIVKKDIMRASYGQENY